MVWWHKNTTKLVFLLIDVIFSKGSGGKIKIHGFISQKNTRICVSESDRCRQEHSCIQIWGIAIRAYTKFNQLLWLPPTVEASFSCLTLRQPDIIFCSLLSDVSPLRAQYLYMHFALSLQQMVPFCSLRGQQIQPVDIPFTQMQKPPAGVCKQKYKASASVFTDSVPEEKKKRRKKLLSSF